MEELYFRIVKDTEDTYKEAIIGYELSASEFKEVIKIGNISENSRPFNLSYVNEIYEQDNFISVCRNQINSDFPTRRDWQIDELDTESLLDEIDETRERLDAYTGAE